MGDLKGDLLSVDLTEGVSVGVEEVVSFFLRKYKI